MGAAIAANTVIHDMLFFSYLKRGDMSDLANGWAVKAVGFDQDSWDLEITSDSNIHDVAIRGLDSSVNKRVEAEWQKYLADQPRTVLGYRLQNIRAKIIASGRTLLSWDEIEHEIAERRGEAGFKNEEDHVH